MEAKLILLRDDGTAMPMLALRASGGPSALLAQAGFGATGEHQQSHVLLCDLNNLSQLTYDEFDWQSRSTFALHRILQRHWDDFEDGDEIDVRDWFEEVLPGTKFEGVLLSGHARDL